jgi:low molecular weight phosphotyrosine protein phosphatase
VHHFDLLISGSMDAVDPQFGVPIEHEARKVSQNDFYNFTHILASDKSNLENLLRIKPSNATAEVKLWGSYLDDKPIADPYYGGVVSRNKSVYDDINTKYWL